MTHGGGALLERGRDAFDRRRWTDAYRQLSAAHQQAPLEPADLERLAMSAYLIGKEADAVEILTRAHHALVARGDAKLAARAAFWLAFTLISRGERAAASGWTARARRLLDEHEGECVERGYLLLRTAMQSVEERDFSTAAATYAQAAAMGDRFGDKDLAALARQGRGRILIRLGMTAEGVAMLDEIMVAVTAGELSPIIAGVVYCGVISACFEIFDVRRAREWTDALSRWCASQTDLVPYRGVCLVHRAEIMRLNGVWSDAIEEARRACACLTDPPGQLGAGSAFYELAELHRLRGEFGEAEDAYRNAGDAGRPPQPGLALLRLAQGRVDLAKAAICRLVDETGEPRARSTALAASVDVLLASNDLPSARRAAEELSAIASALDTPLVRAVSARATGSVLVAEGDAKAALPLLREAWTRWRELDAPYEIARTSVLLGLACRAVGDVDTARMEFEAARRAFEQLGAAPDLARLAQLTGPAASGVLTARELQVLRLVACGRTNRAIAEELDISEKTVARHISNIFNKLDLSSRAAATAYAFQHQLTT